MSQLAAIEAAQNNLEESFTKRMAELEAQLHSGGAKDTVARVAEEFRAFRELMFSMLSLLRKQIGECSRLVDAMETRHRRKALIFLGVTEAERENCTGAVLHILHKKLELNNISASNIISCHRIGALNKEPAHPRPIVVRFSNVDLRSSVWRCKTKLKGTAMSVKEFLTKSRQAVFTKARQHFGMRACWTQDGVITVSVDGARHKLTTVDELHSLTAKHPRASNEAAAAASSGFVNVGSTGAKSRRN